MFSFDFAANTDAHARTDHENYTELCQRPPFMKNRHLTQSAKSIEPRLIIIWLIRKRMAATCSAKRLFP